MNVDPFPRFLYPPESVRGSRAATRLDELRRELEGSGRIPVILGNRENLDRLMEAYEFNVDSGEPTVLNADPEAWFESQFDEDPEAYAGLEEDEFYPDAAKPSHRLLVGFDHRGNEEDVFIGVLEAGHSWELPLRLLYGSWNSCPAPGVRALVARYWREKFGAEIAVMTSDTIEFTVASPPVEKEACKALARQMYLYCPDIVDQGVGSVSTLAKCVEGSTTWYFWWD